MAFNQHLLTSTFERNAIANGASLQLNYGGPFTLNPQTFVVARTPITPNAVSTYGFTFYKIIKSDFMSERLDKWGKNFLPDASVIFSSRVPTANLVSIVDSRNPQGDILDVIVCAPVTLSEGIYSTVYVRSAPVYNSVVSIVTQDPTGDGVRTRMTNIPARISFPGAAGQLAGGSASTFGGESSDAIAPYTTPVLEIPVIFDQSGNQIQLNPQFDFMIDAAVPPTVWPPTDGTYVYRVTSPNMDAGGDFHHQRYQLVLDNN